jgi:hypothetical protein
MAAWQIAAVEVEANVRMSRSVLIVEGFMDGNLVAAVMNLD